MKTTKKKATAERICIARNKAREESMKANIDGVFARSTMLVDSYNSLIKSHHLPPLSNDMDLHNLHRSPVDFAKARYKSSIEVPAGMIRDTYFKLMDLSPIERAFEGVEPVGQWYAGLLTLTDGVVTINEDAAQTLIESGNSYVQNGTQKHAAFERLQALIQTANELNAQTGGGLFFSTLNPQFNLDQIADREFRNSPVTYRLDPSKTRRLLDKVREHDDI